MLLLLFFAFLSGLVTILAPCIWPLLPIVLSSSAFGKDHKKPLGITIGILFSFGVFTLVVSSIVMLFHLDPAVLRFVAVAVIGFLGLTMIIPSLASVLEILVGRMSGAFGMQKQSTKNGFLPGFVTGVSLGIVWSPCAGPILASIATLAAVGQVSVSLILVTTAYLVGIGIPLFLFAYGGQKIFTRTKFISAQTGHIQQVFGVIMLLTALAIYTNYDKVIQVKLLNFFPQYSDSLTRLETNDTVKKQLDILKGKESKTNTSQSADGLFNENYQSPEFTGITKWLNTPIPLTMQSLRGKVVLVDFWTYTCINCLRTLPHVTAWYDKYKDQGFVVIGVHTPEFAFEKESQNVTEAIKQYNIHYPVPQDNEYATWNAFNNQYWPAEYLIDANGIVRKTHFGEGEYDQMEMAIQALLREKGKKVAQNLVQATDQTPTGLLTPETYLGSRRIDRFSSNEQIKGGLQTFSATNDPVLHYVTYKGSWDVGEEYAMPKKGALLQFHFLAGKVFLVITPKDKNDTIKVLLDGKGIDKSVAGKDVVDGFIQVDVPRLYNLVDLHGKKEEHLLELQFQTDTTAVFAFTFG